MNITSELKIETMSMNHTDELLITHQQGSSTLIPGFLQIVFLLIRLDYLLAMP